MSLGQQKEDSGLPDCDDGGQSEADVPNTVVPGADWSLAWSQEQKAFLYAQGIFISFCETAGSVPLHTLKRPYGPSLILYNNEKCLKKKLIRFWSHVLLGK